LSHYDPRALDELSLKELRALIFVAKVEFDERERKRQPINEDVAFESLLSDFRSFQQRKKSQRHQARSAMSL